MLVNSLEEMARHMKKEPKGYLLAFDPGETTGFARFFNGQLSKAEQLHTGTVPEAYNALKEQFDAMVFSRDEYVPVEIVAEDYRIYSWKTEDHSWSAVHTVKVVGLIEMFCHIHNFPLALRMAQQAKQFMTDKKLTDWGLWQPGMRHARDAIRHGCYHILFGTK